MLEFKKYPKIPRLDNSFMRITQKIHGTNAQVTIFYHEKLSLGMDVVAGSRNRWLTTQSDNYGFASFVEENKQEFIDKLGVGTHYGEWAGPGINSTEGLKEKTFLLFNTRLFGVERPLPPQTRTVPVLYEGEINTNKIQEVMDDLKTNGSKLVEGFMRPEGIVISINGQLIKKVFDQEETQWNPKKVKNKKNKKNKIDYEHLLQPLRLEKLLSRDSYYLENYPESISRIVKDYIQDLIAEDQIFGEESEIKIVKKASSGAIFSFIRQFVGAIKT